MAAIAYATHAFSEPALWPLLVERAMTFKQIDKFLETSRGSIPASPSALFAARGFDSILVLVCTVFISLLPLSSAPVVGYAYGRHNISVPMQSEYQPGGGIGSTYSQTNPPTRLRYNAATLYASWSSGLSEEPLPEHRDWFIDRQKLAMRGNMSVTAVRMNQKIDCRSWEPKKISAEGKYLKFPTKMQAWRDDNDEDVQVHRLPRLTVWVHDYAFMSATRTKTTLVFAAINGSISGGFVTRKIPEPKKKNANLVTHISTVACDVDLEFVDETLRIGDAPKEEPGAPISTLANVMVTAPNSTTKEEHVRFSPKDRPEDTLNQLALWMTVAPVTNGISFAGAQPLYQYADTFGLPAAISNTGMSGPNDGWDMPYIETFIRVSIGASAVADSSNWPDKAQKPVPFTSYIHTSKLDPARCIFLVIPPAIVLLNGLVLLLWNVYAHRKLQIPIMRLAKLSEILKSAQTEDVHRRGKAEMYNSNEVSRLGEYAVRFGVTGTGFWGLLSPDDQRGLLGGHELVQRRKSTASLDTLEYLGAGG